jgi:prophage regulatory protein
MSLPDVGYVRLPQIIGCAKRGIPAVIPVSRSTWWAGVRSGRYPQGKLLSAGVRVWSVQSIRELL